MTKSEGAGARRLAPCGLAAALLGVACGEAPPPPEPPVRPVRTVEARAAVGGRIRTFSGVAHAGIESSLGFRVAGVVSRVAVGVGQRVRAGETLAELDPVDYQILATEAEAALRQAEAQAENADAQLRRTRNLYENDNAARTDLDAATASAASARAQVESAARRLERAELQAAYTRLTAPVAGAVAAVLAEVGESVSAGQPVVELASGAAPEVEFGAPEARIREIRQGAPASVVFDALPGARFDGVITEVGVAPGAQASTFPVTVRLGAGGADIRSGMSAEVSVEFGESGPEDRFIVPVQAVGEDRAGRFVFVAEPAGGGLADARRRAVTVGEFAEGGLEILGGLAEGELVVVAGVTRIQDGDRVRLGPAE